MQFSYDFAGTPQTVDVSNDSKVWQVIPIKPLAPISLLKALSEPDQDWARLTLG